MKDAHQIRRSVFIEEQNVPDAIEMDGLDEDAVHLVVYEDKKPVATGRMLINDGHGGGDNELTIGRVAVLKEKRGRGYGGLVMRMLIRKAFEKGFTMQYIHAQVSVRGFYETLGFQAYGGAYEEAGIPHLPMRRKGDIGGGCAF
jgi:predicted GNAT family N-acyltransferase